MEIRQALTFDDVMLVPAASSILPGDTDTKTRITREIELGIPLISAAMDTVTEGALAIAMAQAGGLGVIHRNLPIDQQAAEVRKVKKFEAGMVVNPVTIHPDETLAGALRLMADFRISGIPVVETGGKSRWSACLKSRRALDIGARVKSGTALEDHRQIIGWNDQQGPTYEQSTGRRERSRPTIAPDLHQRRHAAEARDRRRDEGQRHEVDGHRRLQRRETVQYGRRQQELS